MLDFVLTKRAAQLLGMTPHGVRVLSDRGELPALRVDGTRLYSRATVERLARRRAQQREAANGDSRAGA